MAGPYNKRWTKSGKSDFKSRFDNRKKAGAAKGTHFEGIDIASGPDETVIITPGMRAQHMQDRMNEDITDAMFGGKAAREAWEALRGDAWQAYYGTSGEQAEAILRQKVEAELKRRSYADPVHKRRDYSAPLEGEYLPADRTARHDRHFFRPAKMEQERSDYHDTYVLRYRGQEMHLDVQEAKTKSAEAIKRTIRTWAKLCDRASGIQLERQ